jgi:hypothetical protein
MKNWEGAQERKTRQKGRKQGKNEMSRRNWKHQSETGNKEGREKALSTDQKKTITSQQ